MQQGEKILVIGASGMVGVSLVLKLREKYGGENVIASDIREENAALKDTGPYIILDGLDENGVKDIIKKEKISSVYLLAGLMSAGAEKNPTLAWNLNMGALKLLLDLAIEFKFKIFWPSSIAVFGPTTPRDNTPQHTILEPSTIYGVTKYAGELLCQYYFKKYGVDVRSLRYPGLISWKSEPGPGTTEYAVEIFYGALNEKKFTSPLKADSYLPMMYMEDAIRGTLMLMDVPSEQVKNRMSYNFSAISFSPAEIAAEVKKLMPEFEIKYEPDFRQAIADSWPKSIDDSEARADWGWKHEYDLPKMAEDMMNNLKVKLGK
ncbi:MAG: NAD-dependent epimerase/dehydratase family protein [Candidatus Paceibacterota bacterium]|jgi:nucleoside-diphosphate-sugar epimerase